MKIYVLSQTLDEAAITGIPFKHVVAKTITEAIRIVYDWFFENFPGSNPVIDHAEWNTLRADFILYKADKSRFTFSLIETEEINVEKN